MPTAMEDLVARARADVLVVSYNDESWITPEQMTRALRAAGRECVEVVAFDSKRYVGAQIGVHGPTGEKVGEVKRLRNVEYLFLAGDTDRVSAAAASAAAAAPPVRGGA
jgi:adenine-specific DNA-methyltransferase